MRFRRDYFGGYVGEILSRKECCGGGLTIFSQETSAYLRSGSIRETAMQYNLGRDQSLWETDPL